VCRQNDGRNPPVEAGDRSAREVAANYNKHLGTFTEAVPFVNEEIKTGNMIK